MDPRDQRIAELEAENAAQRARISELERKLEESALLVLTLKEQLAKNSGNSNKPPSSDSPGDRAGRRGKGPTGGKRGGQPGHSGSTRALVPPEQVGEFKNLLPPVCENCWVALPQTSTAVQRSQTLELPPLKPDVTEVSVQRTR